MRLERSFVQRRGLAWRRAGRCTVTRPRYVRAVRARVEDAATGRSPISERIITVQEETAAVREGESG